MSILQKLNTLISGRPVSSIEASTREDEKLAAAALMVEVAAHDGTISTVERKQILKLLEQRLGLSREDALMLFAEALTAQNDANHMLGFTRKIKDHFDETGREHILELLWTVVFADGVEDPYESNLMRRITSLLYISDRRNGEIRKKVINRIQK